MTKCRFDDVPPRMRSREIDHRGFPVPWFVTQKTEDGLWDFRVVHPNRVVEAYKFRRCWVSGEKMGRYVSFVVGPMCVVNRVAADPPACRDVAEWSAQVCPFLSRPLAKRPEYDGPISTPGVMVQDNPGMCAVWTTTDYECGRDRLFRFGDPVAVTWWREGRLATQDEITLFYEERCAKLREIAAEDGSWAVAQFERAKRRADQYARQMP